MSYNLNWVKSQYATSAPLDYIFFWGHRARKDGSIGKSCFSQWWISEFEHEGLRFTSAEQWMMYGKAMLFQDHAVAQEILDTHDPSLVKKLGRKVSGFDDPTWKAHRYEIVKQGNLLKFSQDAALQQYLHSTGDKIIVEASPYDRIWGIGLKADAKGIEDPNTWQGENLLGFAIMEVRDALLK